MTKINHKQKSTKKLLKINLELKAFLYKSEFNKKLKFRKKKKKLTIKSED